MKILKLAAITAAIASTHLSALAENTTAQDKYIDVGYTALTADFGALDFSPTALRVVVGNGLTENLAVEAMLMTGLSVDTRSASGGGASASASVKLGLSGGLFLKPRMKFGTSNDHEIFGRIGYFRARGDVNASANAYGTKYALSSSGSQSDIAIGAGAKFGIAKDAHLTLDYMRYSDKNGLKLDGVTVGFAKQF